MKEHNMNTKTDILREVATRQLHLTKGTYRPGAVALEVTDITAPGSIGTPFTESGEQRVHNVQL